MKKPFALLVTTAVLTLVLVGITPTPVLAQKKSGVCSQDACYKACASRGGQIRYCASYCEKRIRDDKRCK